MDEIDQAPTTIKEVGIHISYMRRDMHAMRDLLAKLPAAADFENVKKAVDKHETAIRALQDDKQRGIGVKMSRKELAGWLSAFALAMSAAWWLPNLLQVMRGH